jgi:hypothetical protein
VAERPAQDLYGPFGTKQELLEWLLKYNFNMGLDVIDNNLGEVRFFQEFEDGLEDGHYFPTVKEIVYIGFP